MGGVAQEYRCRKGSTAPLQGVFQRSRRAECAFIDSYSWRSCKSSYSTRAADASPRRSANPTTLRMRTVRSSPIVSTSPAFTAWPVAFSRTPLMRTWPASISAAALVRAFTTRACHNHLSRRWRSKQHHSRMDSCLEHDLRANAFRVCREGKPGTTLSDHTLALILAGGELFFQRRQFGKRRIGIDRALAFARRRAGRELPVRRPAIAFVAAALFATAMVATTPGLALVLVGVPALAGKAFAGGAALVVASFAHRRTIGWCRRGFDRRIRAGFTEIIAVVAPSAAVTL